MPLKVEDWGFGVNKDGTLVVAGAPTEDLARSYGTPLHILDESGLRGRARDFRRAFEASYPGPVSAHYALKCNSTPAVVGMVLDEGLRPEVGTLYEWELVRKLGAPPEEIIVNGPCKGRLLDQAIREGAGQIVIDSLEELALIERSARAAKREPAVLIRVNPDCVPKGMNRASATGSRRQSVFGLDLSSGEVDRALERLAGSGPVRFAGFHCHVGTGIGSATDYRRPLHRLVELAAQAHELGLQVDVLDVGGGFGVPTSRELNTAEFLLYQGAGRLPHAPRADRFPPFERFAASVSETVTRSCLAQGLPLPRLILEPGRAIVSAAGLLLLTVGVVKKRRGVGTWVVTDGGAGTVAFPLYYEYHEIFLCRAPSAPRTHRYSIVGPACHSADWIYRNKQMPEIVPGDVIAICDAGAYFTVQESNFGFPRPPIIAVRNGKARTLRRRETFEDMVARDIDWGNGHAA